MNKRIAVNTIEAENATSLLLDVVGNPWDDFYWHKRMLEYAIIATVSKNRENVPEPATFLAEATLGKGKIIISQLKAEPNDEKDIRVYSCMLSNLGCDNNTEFFSHERTVNDYAVDFIMTLPISDKVDYDVAKAYFTDPQYSLNNLGEGLYGWMNKIEKDPIQIIKWSNMYESIENGFDACENIAECIEEVLLKNS